MSKKSTPPLQRHLTHRSEIRPGSGPHPAQYYCLQCQKHIAWLNRAQAELARSQGLL